MAVSKLLFQGVSLPPFPSSPRSRAATYRGHNDAQDHGPGLGSCLSMLHFLHYTQNQFGLEMAQLRTNYVPTEVNGS